MSDLREQILTCVYIYSSPLDQPGSYFTLEMPCVGTSFLVKGQCHCRRLMKFLPWSPSLALALPCLPCSCFTQSECCGDRLCSNLEPRSEAKIKVITDFCNIIVQRILLFLLAISVIFFPPLQLSDCWTNEVKIFFFKIIVLSKSMVFYECFYLNRDL